jgi:hypothetical protein
MTCGQMPVAHAVHRRVHCERLHESADCNPPRTHTLTHTKGDGRGLGQHVRGHTRVSRGVKSAKQCMRVARAIKCEEEKPQFLPKAPRLGTQPLSPVLPCTLSLQHTHTNTVTQLLTGQQVRVVDGQALGTPPRVHATRLRCTPARSQRGL